MDKKNYTDSHDQLRVYTRRFESSPYLHKYADRARLFGIYARRLHVLNIGEDTEQDYWTLRRKASLFDVPERPIEIKGPDAIKLLEKVFCRRIADLKVWRARYAIACNHRGGIQMDGVLMRLALDSFWYVQADGEIESWMDAYTDGLDVEIRDPRSRVLQIQGPTSLDVMRSATNGQMSDSFRYFHVGNFDFGGQEILVSRTGWTGEMGVELYSDGFTTDHGALWDHLMTHGKEHGMVFCGATSLNTRRIEAGILDNGTDIDRTMTPFAAGLGNLVDIDKPDFIGRAALQQAEKGRQLFGLKCPHAVPLAGLEVLDGNQSVASMTIGTWSPYLDTGIGFVRFHEAHDWLGRELTLRTHDGQQHTCEIVDLPFYDEEKNIPRGRVHDIP